MGRFYQTTRPNFVDDTIYRPPWELMAKTLENADKRVDATLKDANDLYGILKVDSLEVDSPRVQKILNAYHQKIDDISKQVLNDPLNYKKNLPSIRDLSRTIQEDMARGEIAAISGNKKTYDEWEKRQLENIKSSKGKVLPGDVDFAKKYFLDRFQGTNYKGQDSFDKIGLEEVSQYKDLEELGEDRAKGYVADAITENNAYSDGEYIYTSSDKEEVMDPKIIADGVRTAMINDRELMDYYSQQVRLGKMTIGDVDKMVEGSVQRLAEKYGFKKTEGGIKSQKEDPYSLEGYRQSNRKDLAKFKKSLEDEGVLASPLTPSILATKEAQLLLDSKTVEKSKAIADQLGIPMGTVTGYDKDGKAFERAISPTESIEVLRSQLRKHTLLAKEKGSNPKIMETIASIKENINMIEKEYDNGRAVSGWTGYADLLHTQGHTEDDISLIATKAKKNLENYVRNGSINDLRTSVIVDKRSLIGVDPATLAKLEDVQGEPSKGRFIGSINELENQLGIKVKVIPTSVTPTIITANQDKQHLNQFDFKATYIIGKDEFGEGGVERTLQISVPNSELKLDLFEQ